MYKKFRLLYRISSIDSLRIILLIIKLGAIWGHTQGHIDPLQLMLFCVTRSCDRCHLGVPCGGMSTRKCIRSTFSCSFWENRSPASSEITVCWVVPSEYCVGHCLFWLQVAKRQKGRKWCSPTAASTNGHRWVRSWYTKMLVGVCPYMEISKNFLFYDVIAMGLYFPCHYGIPISLHILWMLVKLSLFNLEYRDMASGWV